MDNRFIGTSVKVAVTFKDELGALIDPPTVTLLIRAPNGTETAYTYGDEGGIVIRESQGVYYAWILPESVGRYLYRFKGAGANSVANESHFIVSPSSFAAP